MRIKVNSHLNDEWKECWLETEYKGTEDITLETWLYPTTWDKSWRNDGHYSCQWYSKEARINLRSWIWDCGAYLKPKEINERPTTALQKISDVFKRIFSWEY